MAHELTFHRGRAEMFSVKVTPWHREGTVLAEAPNLDEAMRLGGLNFEVLKTPTEIILPNGDRMPSQTSFTTVAHYRDGSDRHVELGQVGPDYVPLQNADAFRAVEPLLDSGIATLETGGSLRSGADVWMATRFNVDRFGPIVREVFANEVVPYAIFTNNHTGRRSPSIMLSPIRPVCANTLGASEQLADAGQLRIATIRHTGDVAGRYIEAAAELLGGLVERYERLAEGYRTLKNCFLTDAAFRALVVEPIAPDPRWNRSFNPDAKTAELVIARYEAKRDALVDAWMNGSGHTGDGSAWEAYNGAVEVIDHNKELFPNRAGAYRTASLLHGDLRQKKERVFTQLLAHANA